MDQIEFVIAKDELGGEPLIVVEPVVNGESLVETIETLTGTRYGGLWHQHAVERLMPPFGSYAGQLLGCGCGDDRCSWVAARLEFTESAVILSNIRSDVDSETRALATIGPFTFDRAAFEHSLRDPTPRDLPVRSSR